jgi:ectoine hydroxylase-related dioxygenase (phytanoyl-CoA dioxygenase family)
MVVGSCAPESGAGGPMSTLQTDRAREFRERSYFVVPAFVDTAELTELRSACDLVLERVRAESSTKGHTSPSVSVLTNIGYFEVEPRALQRLTAFVASARVCAQLEGLAYADEPRTPRLKKAEYYHEQTEHDWDGDWHRDSQFVEYAPERERALVLGTTWVHVRVALAHDDRLEIVAGSHRRWDTDEELGIRKGAQRTSAKMPGASRIALRAGDACVFHAWSIHRATYQRTPLRRTLDALYAFGRLEPARYPGFGE